MKKQGNISIMVLFVLVASSLIWVLTMNFVNQMIYASDVMTSYYNSYYLSNAGLELLLTEAKHRGIWFELTIGTWSSIFKENFGCTNCDFTAKMEWTSTTVSKEFWKESSGSCVSPIVLAQGESMMIPMIKDIFSWTTAQNFVNPPVYENLSSGLRWLNFTLASWDFGEVEINIGLIILAGDELLNDGIFVRTWMMRNGTTTMEDFVTAWEATASTMLPDTWTINTLNVYYASPDYKFKNYLILANTNSWTISFCINSETPLPTDNFHITSNGMYHGQTIGLELIYKQPIPSFLMNSVLGSMDSQE